MGVDSTIFVGDLSVICLAEHLTDLFKEYGTVLKSEILQGVQPYRFLGYGFITMSTVKEASYAMECLNGVMLFGRKLRYKC